MNVSPDKINIYNMKSQTIILSLALVSIICAQTCAHSQYFNGQRCAPCQSNCQCTQENQCDRCLPGYTFDAQFKNCLQCPTGIDSVNVGCQQCCFQITNTEFVCSSCPSFSHTYLKGGQCIRIQGCTSITDKGRCKACSDGYYLKDGICEACDSSCDTCYHSSFCLTCTEGYFNGTDVGYALCQACPTGCATCTSLSACDTCNTGYYLDASSCLACAANCEQCSAGGCSKCDSSSALIGSTCHLCTDVGNGGSVGCTRCEQDRGSLECTRCSDGYFLNAGGGCALCSSAYPNSILCTSNKPIQCTDDFASTLSDRYYLVGNKCVENTNNCKEMADNTGKCSSCYFEAGAYYRLTNNKKCLECSQRGCSTYNSDTCACQACQDGYRFANAQCSACSNLHCKQCNADQAECEACDRYYGLVSSACVGCTKENCLNCDGDKDYCALCEDGYYLADGVCYSCQGSCLKCTASTTCTKCSGTHYLLDNGRCKTLPSNCVEVDEDGECTKCEYGYRILFGSCFECSSSLFNLHQCERFCPDYYTETVFDHHYSTAIALAVVVLALNA